MLAILDLRWSSTAEWEELRADLVSCYYRAFSPPPYSESADAAEAFGERLERVVRSRGFRGYVARGEGGKVSGFAYGYVLSPSSALHEDLANALGPRSSESWLSDAFYVEELAVLPSVARSGIGGRLLETLLARVPTSSAVLLVRADAGGAVAFYKKNGWIILRDDYRFSSISPVQMIMGRQLSRPGTTR